MKKYVLIMGLFLITLFVSAQEIVKMPTTTAPFTKIYKAGSIVEVATIPTFIYILRQDVGKPRTMAWVLADSTRFYYISVNVGLVNMDTYYVDTANDQNISGHKNFLEYQTIMGQRMTADHTNNLLFSNSVTSTDTTFANKGIYLGLAGLDGKINIYSEQGATDYLATLNPNSTMTSAANFFLPADEPASTLPMTMSSGGIMAFNDQALTTTSDVKFDSTKFTDNVSIDSVMYGNAWSRGSGAFTTTLTRAAVYIKGALATDYYIVGGIATDQYTRPVAGDFMNCFAKLDSLIVMRQAGTTSGLRFTYFRMK